MPSSLNSLFLARWHAVCYDEQRIWKLSMQNEQPIQKKKKTARATASMAVMKDQFHSFFFTILFFFFSSSFGVGISPDTDCRGARSTW